MSSNIYHTETVLSVFCYLYFYFENGKVGTILLTISIVCPYILIKSCNFSLSTNHEVIYSTWLYNNISGNKTCSIWPIKLHWKVNIYTLHKYRQGMKTSRKSKVLVRRACPESLRGSRPALIGSPAVPQPMIDKCTNVEMNMEFFRNFSWNVSHGQLLAQYISGSM